MAKSKLAFSKLAFKANSEVATITIGENNIEVKQYLPVDEKLALAQTIINESADDKTYYNIGKIDINLVLNIVFAYTNLTFTEKILDNRTALYDLIISNGLWEDVLNCIPKSEYTFIQNMVYGTIEQIYKYRNSVYGILDTISKDYNDLELDASKIQSEIGDKENIATLRDVLNKLG